MTKSSSIVYDLFLKWTKDIGDVPKNLSDRDLTMLIKGFTGGVLMSCQEKDRKEELESFIKTIINQNLQ